MRQDYDIVKNPKNGLWYVIGYCGCNKQGRQQWIPVSSGYSTKQDALAYMKKLPLADNDMVKSLSV